MLKGEIEKLSPEEFAELRNWLLEKDWEAWDRQIEQDASGKLEELFETAHLLRSPKNAERLLSALARSRRGEGEPETVEELRRDLGLDDAVSDRHQ